MKKNLVTLLKFSLFLGVGLTILYFVYIRQETAYQAQCIADNIPKADCSLIQKIIDDFKGTNFFWIFMVLIAFIISNISRAIRWHMFLKPLGYRPRYINSFFSIIIGYFANLGLPRVGEVVRAATLSKYENIPVEKTIGTIVVDRSVDLLSLLTAFGLVLLFEYDTIWSYLSENVGQGENNESLWEKTWFQVFALIVIVAGAAVAIFKNKIQQLNIYKKFQNILHGFLEGIKSIGKLDKPLLFIFHSINIWFMYFMMAYLCFFAFEPTAGLPPVAGLVVFVFGSFGILIPSPGGMGTFHFMAVEALSIYGVSAGDAFSFANILFFSVQIGCSVVVGIAALLLLPIINRNYNPTHSGAT